MAANIKANKRPRDFHFSVSSGKGGGVVERAFSCYEPHMYAFQGLNIACGRLNVWGSVARKETGYTYVYVLNFSGWSEEEREREKCIE